MHNVEIAVDETKSKEEILADKRKVLKQAYNKVAIIEAIKQGDEALVVDLEAQLNEKAETTMEAGKKSDHILLNEEIDMIEDYLNQQKKDIDDMRNTQQNGDGKTMFVKRGKDNVLRVGGSPLK